MIIVHVIVHVLYAGVPSINFCIILFVHAVNVKYVHCYFVMFMMICLACAELLQVIVPSYDFPYVPLHS